ncbi:levanase [Aspergillus udagawae]|uniref:Levanase n=1 Tax=Aspergillus udagawae TaxID=91492 RepID=A0A8H3XSI8_9EURO|nr:levanase [Aspergillus udagawae]
MGSALNSPIYRDYGEFFMNSSNILAVPYGSVTAAFKAPVAVHSTAIDGFDWTQPYPGSHRDGHTAYLEVAQEMPLSASIVENATTVLSSLTFGIPDSMSSGGQPLAMDPSWYICRHVFISTKPEAKQAVDGGSKCGFLSQACQADLKTSLTQDWGKAADGTMCAALGFDPIPLSCQDSFGLARQDVMAFDAAFLANPALGPVQTSKDQQQYSWRIGTGYHDPGDARAYALAANRTYLVATVWGYSQSVKSSQVPGVSFACLSSGASYVPPPPGPPSSTVAFGDDFSSGSLAQWKTYGGSFDASSGALVGSQSFGGKALVSPIFGDFLYEADVTLPSTSGNAGLVFRVSNPSIGADAYNGYYAGISASGVVLGRASNSWTALASSSADLAANKVHHIKVQARNTALDIFVDDMSKAKVSVTDGTYSSGMNGVRVFDTGATFDNIRITPLAFSDDFSSGTMGKWTTIDGTYQVSSNAAVMSASPGARALATAVTFTDLIYEADVSIDSTVYGNGGFIFRVSNAKAGGPDSYNGYYAGIGNGYVVLGFADYGWNELKNVPAADIKPGQKHHLMIRTSGDSISVFVDDLNTPRMVVKNGKYSAGSSGLRAYMTTMSVSNVRIYTA